MSSENKLFGVPIEVKDPGWWELKHALCDVRGVVTFDNGYMITSKYCKDHNEIFVNSERTICKLKR